MTNPPRADLAAVLVGCGAISQTWLSAIREIPALKVVGLVDLVEDAARRRVDEYGLHDAIVSTDLNAALEKTRPDVVFDCTVPKAHVHVTLEALRHGCHVLGEKPMADSLDNARKMVAAAQKAGKIYAVTQNYRYGLGVRRLKSFLESEEIGRVTTVHSDFYVGAHFGGFRDRMKHVLLLDMAIHFFDAARFITGADAVSVYCKDWNPAGSWYDHGASAVAIFEMSGGIVYTYRGSWCAEGLNTTWGGEWRIIGEQGSVKWDGGDSFQAQVVAETGGFFSKWRDVDVPAYGGGDKVDKHASLIREFVHSVKTGTIPETICTDNIKSLAMVLGTVESAELGKSVKVVN
jgi:predicted dehydrogenase